MRDTCNASNVGNGIRVSDVSKAKTNISSHWRHVVSDANNACRVSVLRLSGQVKVRIGTVYCSYSTRSSGIRIVVTSVTSVTSGMQVTLDWLVTLVTFVMLLMQS